MTWLTLVLLIAASFRLTHLIVMDSIMAPVRDRLERVPFLGEVITCYWCCGIWVSGGLVAAYLLWPAVAYWVLLIFAVAGGQALLETLVQRE
ncbi:MAG: sporulation protein [Symbiobacteriaceae bacterium]|jgi:fatty acid desaturase|nr:sporulation protein [Symbiobacteriaceae bacterium]